MITKKELNEIILKDLNIGGLPAESQDKILEKLGENITNRIFMAILEKLPEDARVEFDAVSASGDEIKMQEFLKLKIVNIEELIQRIIQLTISEFKEMAGIK